MNGNNQRHAMRGLKQSLERRALAGMRLAEEPSSSPVTEEPVEMLQHPRDIEFQYLGHDI
jgi:hypothetical protein